MNHNVPRKSLLPLSPTLWMRLMVHHTTSELYLEWCMALEMMWVWVQSNHRMKELSLPRWYLVSKFGQDLKWNFSAPHVEQFDGFPGPQGNKGCFLQLVCLLEGLPVYFRNNNQTATNLNALLEPKLGIDCPVTLSPVEASPNQYALVLFIPAQI